MKIDELVERTLDAMDGMGIATAKEIQEAIGDNVAIIQVHQALKRLVDSDLIEMVLKDDIKYYSLVKTKGTENTSVNVGKGARDRTKYLFDGVEYNKSRTALAIIAKFVKEDTPDLNRLEEVFPMKLIPTYGLVRRLEEALALSKKGARFFINERDVLELTDGPVCVSNQFTKERIEKLITVAQNDLGYDIQVVS